MSHAQPAPAVLGSERPSDEKRDSASGHEEKERRFAPAAVLAASEPGGVESQHTFTAGELHVSDDERRVLLRRLDKRVMPYVTLLYLLSFLDRVNIGQAAGLGLRRDLGIVRGNRYAIALSIFFVFYVASEIPALLVFKRLGVRRAIPIIMIAWSLVLIGMGLVKTSADLIATRALLGLFEGPLFPLLNYMLSCWYSRAQLGTRVGIFFSGATLAGAFGGLLAYGLAQIHMPAGPYEGEQWRWIFIIEGILTLVCAIPGFWMLLDFPAAEKRMFEPLSKARWNHVLAKSQGVTSADIPFTWSQVRSAFTDWRVWVMSIMYLSVANPLYSLAIFIPQLISGLGAFGRTSSNLLSVPPYVVGFITTMACAFYSDRHLVRSVPIVACMSLTLLGYILFIVESVPPGAKYAGFFFAVGGVSPCIALSITWIGNNVGGAVKRAAAMGLFFSFGNSAGLVSSNVYPLTDAPRYIKGHSINLAFTVLAMACATVLGIANYRENKRRDALCYAKPDGSSADPLKADDEEEKARWGLSHLSKAEILLLGDKHPAFRYAV